MSEAFRVGDLVRCSVIGTDSKDYYLTTAENSLGVLLAWSADDTGTGRGRVLMEPLSYREFRHPVTGMVEKRKVAKPL